VKAVVELAEAVIKDEIESIGKLSVVGSSRPYYKLSYSAM
jgi:hypothetical protein